MTPPLGGWGDPYVTVVLDRNNQVTNRFPILGFGFSEHGRNINVEASGFVFAPTTQITHDTDDVKNYLTQRYLTCLAETVGKVFIPNRYYKNISWLHTTPCFVRGGIWGLRVYTQTEETHTDKRLNEVNHIKPTQKKLHGYGWCLGGGFKINTAWSVDISWTVYLPVSSFENRIFKKNYITQRFHVLRLQIAYPL